MKPTQEKTMEWEKEFDEKYVVIQDDFYTDSDGYTDKTEKQVIKNDIDGIKSFIKSLLIKEREMIKLKYEKHSKAKKRT